MTELRRLLLCGALGIGACQAHGKASRSDVGLPAASAGSEGMSAPTLRIPSGHPADVRFMQDMIAHHAQALTMTKLVPARTSRTELHLLAERIEVSQHDEIKLIQQWLSRHGQVIPSADAHRNHGGMATALMPGMLTHDELDALSRARGTAFERRFLELMIRHHEGALTMVDKLFATAGAGQDSEIYAFATDVDADQRAEIARMRKLLAALPAVK